MVFTYKTQPNQLGINDVVHAYGISIRRPWGYRMQFSMVIPKYIDIIRDDNQCMDDLSFRIYRGRKGNLVLQVTSDKIYNSVFHAMSSGFTLRKEITEAMKLLKPIGYNSHIKRGKNKQTLYRARTDEYDIG